MANQKQDGSNITSIEYYTGRCPTSCEQCFVNFGQQGSCALKNITNKVNRKWFEYAVREGKRPALQGRRSFTWTPPPRDPSGKRLGKIGAKGATAIPMRDNPLLRTRTRTIKIHGRTYPLFLRVSAMSDSSYSPDYWIKEVYDRWGSRCFYNSAIRAIKAAPGNLDMFHKLVVTLNPGKQTMPPIEAVIGRTEGVDPRITRGSIKRVAEDFFNPTTLTDIDYGSYEDIIKFYRFRVLPTVRGRFKYEPTAPIVVTQMRFKSLAHALEFCRHYKLRCEVSLPMYSWSKAGTLKKRLRDILDTFGVEAIGSHDDAIRIKIWSDRSDDRNTSEYAGEASEYVWYSGFMRPENVEPLDSDAYVCDRAHGGCEDCGLCASLDGTQEEDINWENLDPSGVVMGPIAGPEGAFYVGTQKSTDGDYFADLLERYTGEPWAADDVLHLYDYYIRRRNPEAEVSLDEVVYILQEVTDYLLQGDGQSFFCEGWDTHEQANAATAYCVWVLMREARRSQLSDEDAFNFVHGFVLDITDGMDILDGVDDLWGMWTDDSIWTTQFGSIKKV